MDLVGDRIQVRYRKMMVFLHGSNSASDLCSFEHTSTYHIEAKASQTHISTHIIRLKTDNVESWEVTNWVWPTSQLASERDE